MTLRRSMDPRGLAPDVVDQPEGRPAGEASLRDSGGAR